MEREQNKNLLCTIGRQDKIIKATLGAADAATLARASAVAVQECDAADTPRVVERMQQMAIRYLPHPEGAVVASDAQPCTGKGKIRKKKT